MNNPTPDSAEYKYISELLQHEPELHNYIIKVESVFDSEGKHNISVTLQFEDVHLDWFKDEKDDK